MHLFVVLTMYYLDNKIYSSQSITLIVCTSLLSSSIFHLVVLSPFPFKLSPTPLRRVFGVGVSGVTKCLMLFDMNFDAWLSMRMVKEFESYMKLMPLLDDIDE